jgi:Mg-chelatase subunit ChlI
MALLRNELEVNVEVTVQEATFDGVPTRFLSLLAYEDHTIHEASRLMKKKPVKPLVHQGDSCKL